MFQLQYWFFFKQLSIYFSCFPFPKAHFFWLCSSFSILFARRKGTGESKELIKRKLHNHEVLHLASRTFNSWLSNFKYVFQIAYCDSLFPVPTNVPFRGRNREPDFEMNLLPTSYRSGGLQRSHWRHLPSPRGTTAQTEELPSQHGSPSPRGTQTPATPPGSLSQLCGCSPDLSELIFSTVSRDMPPSYWAATSAKGFNPRESESSTVIHF